MKNALPFDAFLQTLKPTNRTLGFYVDWDKCLEACDKIAISLNHLNFLLGKDSGKMKEAVAARAFLLAPPKHLSSHI